MRSSRRYFITPDTFRRYAIISGFLAGEKGIFLDLGCGNCKLQDFVENEKILFVGADRNIDSLREPGKSGRKVICAGAGCLPFKENSLSGAVCTEVLEHVPDDEAVFKELGRVIRPGGACVVTVPNSDSEKVLPLKGLVKNMYDSLEQKVGHLRKGYSLELLEQKFRDNSFQMIEHKYDLKLVGALSGLFYYYWYAKPENNRLRRYIVAFYERFHRALAMLYGIDDFLNREGFTVFAKFKKAG